MERTGGSGEPNHPPGKPVGFLRFVYSLRSNLAGTLAGFFATIEAIGLLVVVKEDDEHLEHFKEYMP